MKKLRYFSKDFEIKEVEPSFFKKLGMYYRPNTCDKKMISEVLRDWTHLEITEDDVVLDLGSNIGAFSKVALDAGAKQVIAIEADEFNHEVLEMNIGSDPRATVLHRAVVGDDSKEITFLIKDNGNSACAGKVCTRESDMKSKRFFKQTIPAINFQDVLDKYRPNLIKIDIEGGEYAILNQRLPDYVKMLAIEIHGMTKETFVKSLKLCEGLKLDFEKVYDQPTVLFFHDNKLLNHVYVRRETPLEIPEKIEEVLYDINNVDMEALKKFKSGELFKHPDGTSVYTIQELNEILTSK